MRGIATIHVVIFALAVNVTLGLSLHAQETEPESIVPPKFEEFTFKRIRAPRPGEPIPDLPIPQVTPEDMRRQQGLDLVIDATPIEDRAADIIARAAPPADLSDWFWSGVSPAITAADFGRMNGALQQLGSAPDGKLGSAADIGLLRNVAQTHGKDILLASLGKSVSPAFILSVIAVESGGRVSVESSAGALGLMQLIPATAERFNVKDPKNPKENIAGGAAYLDFLLKEFQYDPLLALAGYNAGENAVKKHAGIPPFAETRAYVPKVVAAWQVARTLCKTPPVLVTDGCVFNLGG